MEEQRELKLDLGEENLRRLTPEQIIPYFTKLSSRLSQLSEIATREQDEFVTDYINVVKNTLDCLFLKHQLGGEDKVDFSLTIDPSDSGFPTPKDFYLLEKDKEKAKQILGILPSRENIIEEVNGN